MRLIVLSLIGFIIISGCEKSNLVDVKLISPKGKVFVIKAEVADDDHERRLGLMGRKSLAANNGMIFIWPNDAVRSFWMKNTYIPLDIIFAKDKDILGIITDVKPHTEESRNVGKIGNIVLEVNAGFVAKHNIDDSWKLQFKL